MSTTVVREQASTSTGLWERFSWAVADAWIMAKRNLKHIPRNPELLLDVTVQPVMFVFCSSTFLAAPFDVPGDELRQLPDGRHLRSDDRFRLTQHGHRSIERSEAWADRPLSLAADVSFGRGSGTNVD